MSEPQPSTCGTRAHLQFGSDGVELRRGVLPRTQVDAVAAEVGHRVPRAGIRHADKKYGSVADLAGCPQLLSLAAELLGSAPQLVRALLFDKTPQHNWAVAWHQDKTVALAERVELPGFGPWSRKEGVWHVQPPRAVLEGMLTLRLHLDPCDAEGGCLLVLPGTHAHGILDRAAIEAAVRERAAVACAAAAGDVLAMRPLLLHASARARSGSHRRVLHLEYAGGGLPAGCRWA